MNLSVITLEKRQAREAFLAYRDSVRERHSIEDEQIMRGYRWLAGGEGTEQRQLLKLSETIASGGVLMQSRTWGGRPRESRLPRLAIARADAIRCITGGIEQDGGVDLRSQPDLSPTARHARRRLPSGTFEAAEGYACPWDGFYAIVPIVPPPLRPRHALHNYHVLWEADWQQQPPQDPALLKHIGGDLYAVLATWDLTEVERAVLSGRA